MSLRILIVEDEADIREAMADIFTQEQFTVETAENGKTGLEKALATQPDMILLDLVMPVMDGHEMLKKLRQDPWGKHAKVIIMTAMDDVRNVASAHENTINDYIIKAHTSLEDLVKKVRVNIYS